MTPLLQQPVVALYAIASSVLVVSLYALGFLTAKIRNDGRKIINAEDVKVNSGANLRLVELVQDGYVQLQP